MSAQACPGLQAGWLNGWLAALGAAVLVKGMTVSWTNDAEPTGVLHHNAGSPDELLAARFPDYRALSGLAIARQRPDSTDFTRKVTLGDFSKRAALFRSRTISADDRTLEMTTTDLYDRATDEVPHAPFDAAAPKGTTLHDRVMACRAGIERLLPGTDLGAVIARSLRGRGHRIQANGLGFDYRRSASSVHPDAQVYVDPVIEILAFHGMKLFPYRGKGGHAAHARQRGFTKAPSHIDAFTWPTWTCPLDQWAIDALLDRFYAVPASTPTRGARLQSLDITTVHGSIYQQPRGTADTYRAYASHLVWSARQI